MKKKIATYVLILVTNYTFGQEFIDQIVTKSQDTLTCKITLVNDQNIFYTFKKNKSEKQKFISLENVEDYNWKSKDIKPIRSNDSRIFYNGKDIWQIGLNVIQQVNYPISHSIFTINFNKGNHNVYIGPHYTMFYENHFGDEILDNYEKSTSGVNFGYRSMVNSKWPKLNLFFQIDFSLYKVKYYEYQGHLSGSTQEERTALENCGSIGINYKLTEKIEIYAGAGIGSTAGFFLLFDEFIPHSFIGLQYKIK